MGRSEDLALDVIVVLGAPLGPDGRLGRVVRERVEAGVAAWKAGLAPWLLLTGGRTDPSVWADLRAGIYGAQARERSGVAEAAGMRDHARSLGVPAEVILLEDRARSTQENARYAASMMAERGLRRALVVTQPFHLRRSLRWFAKEGVEVVGLHLEESYIYAGGWSSVGALYWVTREYVILTGEQVGRRLRRDAGS
ncbi:MAG TPA: YdcF family protein [Polyangia bacterium]|nr:YdcF family protein [Polyangia bacterium]